MATNQGGAPMIGECRNGMMWTGTHWIPVETGSLAAAYFLRGFVILFVGIVIFPALILWFLPREAGLGEALLGAAIAVAAMVWGGIQFNSGSQMLSRIMHGTNVRRFNQG